MDKPLPPLTIRAQLRWDVVGPVVERLSPRSIIEIGAGEGAMSARLAALVAGAYTGFELDPHSYARAAARIAQFAGKAHNAELGAIRPPAAQMVCAFEVLEHIEDDETALREWAGYIEPGGHLVLSVPAHPERFGPMDTYVGHFRRYSPEGLTSLVEAAGLDQVETRLYGAPLGYALEAVRNVLDAKKASAALSAATPAEMLTAASGRTYQFAAAGWKSQLATAGTLPFRYLQRIWPGGIGIVLSARRP